MPVRLLSIGIRLCTYGARRVKKRKGEVLMQETIRVTVWNEFYHEQHSEEMAAMYPGGIHGTIAACLNSNPDMTARTATLPEPEHGLTEEVLNGTDVLIWWGHMKHGAVADEVVARVHERVLEGMGLICLHTAHASKIFTRLMGTRAARLRWRKSGNLERVWVVAPGHPIAQGLGDYFEIPNEEMFGEVFEIPEPEQLVFISWFAGGEVFRSGCCFQRGAGKIFYFRPGHETFPVYHQPEVQRVIQNAVRWACPVSRTPVRYTTGHTQHPEDVPDRHA